MFMLVNPKYRETAIKINTKGGWNLRLLNFHSYENCNYLR